jgi:hypothetical protein
VEAVDQVIVVKKLMDTDSIDAIIGIKCFPYLEDVIQV